MDFINSIILGVIQGLTEFWPVSSSAHLAIAHYFLNFKFVDELGFDVALHLGTMAALLVFFAKDIYWLILSFIKSFANWDLKNDLNQRLAWYIVVGSMPAGIAGFLLADLAETKFRSIYLIASLLAGVAVVFIISEKYAKQKRGISQLRWLDALIIGIAQAFALLPGVSRSGITTSAGLLLGIKRERAARFSFLLSIPAVFGAGLLKLKDMSAEHLSAHSWLVMLAGFAVSAVVGYFAVKYLLKYLEKNTLNSFAIYRIIMAAFLFFYLFIRG